MKPDATVEAAIHSVLDRLGQAYASRDIERVMELFAPDSDLVMYGTGADEKRVGLAEVKAQIERDWAQSEASTLTYDWTSISAADTVAWVAADARFRFRVDGREDSLPARVTFVLERRGDKWLIVHGHFSFAAVGQAEGQSIPA